MHPKHWASLPFLRRVGAHAEPGVKKDAELTNLLQGLKNAQVRDIGGGMALLSFDSSEPLPDDPKGEARMFIVRDFFPGLFKHLQTGRHWLLTGVPGTGESGHRAMLWRRMAGVAL